MKTLKPFFARFSQALVATLVATLVVSSQPVFAREASYQVCGDALLSTQPEFENVLSKLYSLDYVRAALRAAQNDVPGAKLCTEAVAVGNNNYAAIKLFVRVSVRKPKETTGASFDFLIQDAPVQAFHGTSGEPWTGANPAIVATQTAELLQNAKYRAVNAANTALAPAEIAATYSRTFQRLNEQPNPATLSSIELAPNVHLVTWLTKLGANPYLQPAITRAVIVKTESSSVMISEGADVVSGLRFPLERDISQVSQALPLDRAMWTKRLLESAL